jgi:hypothetical protein
MASHMIPEATSRVRGIQVLHDPTINKSTAYTEAERQALGLVGLVPDVTESEEPQLRRVLQQLGHKTTDLDLYIYLVGLLDNNDTLFYRVLMSDPARFFADRLRSDDRRSLPEVRPHLPSRTRYVSFDDAEGAGKGRVTQLAGPGRACHLCYRRRTHPRVGRPRRQR